MVSRELLGVLSGSALLLSVVSKVFWVVSRELLGWFEWFCIARWVLECFG